MALRVCAYVPVTYRSSSTGFALVTVVDRDWKLRTWEEDSCGLGKDNFCILYNYHASLSLLWEDTDESKIVCLASFSLLGLATFSF